MSASHRNKFATMILAKSRKRDLDIVYTVQSFRQIDVRIRNVSDFLAVPSLNESETICRCPVYSNPSGVLQRVYKFRTASIFDLYDTREEVMALDFEWEAQKLAVEKAVKKALTKAAEKNVKTGDVNFEE